MCRPTHFDVRYSINAWMDPAVPTSRDRALEQWEGLRRILVGRGHRVDVLDPIPGLPDMVFAANGATVVDGRVLVARFRHEQRSSEAPAYLSWFRERGFEPTVQATSWNEGEGDYLFTGRLILAGTGFRSTRSAHEEAAGFFDRRVVGFELVDPRFYHLDTAVAVLDHDEIMYYPGAFSAESRDRLADLFPDAVRASERDALVFGLNAVSDGRNVVLPRRATGLASQLRARGFEPIGVDFSELMKAGGAAKCCTLEIRTADPARQPAPAGERYTGR